MKTRQKLEFDTINPVVEKIINDLDVENWQMRATNADLKSLGSAMSLNINFILERRP